MLPKTLMDKNGIKQARTHSGFGQNGCPTGKGYLFQKCLTTEK